MNINSLPAPLLRRILSSLPLATILRLHHVCSVWAAVQRSILASVTELTILLGNSEGHDLGKKFYHFRIPHLEELENPTVLTADPLTFIKNRNTKFELRFDWLDRFFAELIARQLPNVTSLLISLTRLTFIASPFFYLPSVYYELMPRLIGAINLCRALKHLSLETASGYESGRTRPSSLGDFAVLGWLETLTFDAGELGREAVEGALKYGAGNAHLQAISFSHYRAEVFEGLMNEENLTEENRQVLSKFRQFGFFDLKEVGTENWRPFLSTFTGLQRLGISVEKDGFSQLEEVLRYLGEKNGDSQLLYLNLDLWNFRREDGAVECFEEARNRDRRKENADPAAAPITSVRILRLNTANWQGGEALHFLPWAALLPSLEVLNFTFDGLCSVCYPKENEEEEKEKVAKMLPSLKVTIDGHLTTAATTPITSVKILQVNTESWEGCEELHFLPWAALFPNLEVLNFTYDGLCSVCYPKKEKEDENAEKVAKMIPSLKVTIDNHLTSNLESKKGRKLEQFLLPWAGCSKLRVVHFVSVYDLNDWCVGA
ncbi:hypothetical protein TYRP_009007 [Tyrophagus putrescentiae]|nr:hypothetical protein TYRP_009007 [Tyrophagus putrescentiae]